MKMIAAAIALVGLASSPASAKDWWKASSFDGSTFSACEQITRDDGDDPSVGAVRAGPTIFRNATAVDRWEMSPGVWIVRFTLREGPPVNFIFTTTSAACEAFHEQKTGH